MADVNLSYAEIRSSASKLDQARTDIEEQLGSLKRMIDNLVQSNFVTQSASEKFRGSYEQWDTGAKNVIKGLEGMSSFLTKAVQGHEDLDKGLSAGLNQ